MRGGQKRCAGLENDAGASRPGREKMRSPSGPGKNDAQMHPSAYELNAQRPRNRSSRCARDQDLVRWPSEIFNLPSSRWAPMGPYKARVCIGFCFFGEAS